MALDLKKVITRLATRQRKTEDDIQSDVRTLLLYGGLNLEDDDIEVVLEAQVGGGRRIDIEAGFTVMEIKKDDLRAKPEKKADAVAQLSTYLTQRTDQTGQRYVGVLTDGVSWFLYYLRPDGTVEEVSSFTLDPSEPDPSGLTVWLEAVLATTHQIRPDPKEIEQRLGYRSPGFLLDLADLRSLYAQVADDPSVQLKRELWANLLGAALGENFQDDDELFIRHTYLVAVAELIAHAAVGYEIGTGSYDGYTLLSGELFRESSITGVVEADFFDWPVEAPTGDRFVAALARRIARFDWKKVEHDILKVLYESVIDAETRKSLGEYYTPDWLAERMVTEVVTDPLTQRVLDPACGSGTFLFWAVRSYIEAAEQGGQTNREILSGATAHVFGVDLHPVAVTLARVTYLLALGLERLRLPQERDHVAVPVYLGDSIQWEETHSLLTSDVLRLPTSDGAELFAREIIFPERVIADASRFDQLVGNLLRTATTRRPGSAIPPIDTILSEYNVHPDDRKVVTDTFVVFCQLFDEGRNHIWGYYTRNRARPIWLARDANRVDVLVGNPPWLAYRYMDGPHQKRFRELSEKRKLWAGAELATHQDLSALFVARSVELYLRSGGRFGFVMPAAALSRRQFDGFRAGDYQSTQSSVLVSFDEPWNLTGIQPTIFPVPASVVFGIKTTEAAPMGVAASAWSGNLGHHRQTWTQASPKITISETLTTVASDSPHSPYERIFSQGATLVPRVLVTAEEVPPGPLGIPAGKVAIRSARSSLEKAPWKNLTSLTGTLGERYVRPMYVGTSIAPFRAFTSGLAVVPWIGGELVDGAHQKIDTDPGLAAWWRSAEASWEKNKTSGSQMALLDRVDYQRNLTKQFPIAEHRVVYTKAGANLVAARITDTTAVIDHKLYWAPVGSVDEARFLVCILNSQVLQDKVRPLQSRGQFGPRDFDKYVFVVSFPLYDRDDPGHSALAELGARAEDVADAVVLPAGATYRTARKLIAAALREDGVAAEIEAAVVTLLTPISLE